VKEVASSPLLVKCKAKFLPNGLMVIDSKSDAHLIEELIGELIGELMGELIGNLLQIKMCPNRTCAFMQVD